MNSDTSLPHIGLVGYAGTGKDEAGKILIKRYGYKRIATGDIIKGEMDERLQSLVGISAWTKDPVDNKVIRPLLVRYGDNHFERLTKVVTTQVQESAFPIVNTRILRIEEMQAWKSIGGIVFRVVRKNVGPAEPREEEEMDKAMTLRIFEDVILNDGDLDDLRESVYSVISRFACRTL